LNAPGLAVVLCLDYFIVPPIFSFEFGSLRNLVALVTIEMCALIVSRLSAREKRHAQDARFRRKSMEKLFAVSRGTLQFDLALPPGPQLAQLIRDTFLLDYLDIYDEALSRTDSFAAILLDINMPGMGGSEACRRIRQFAPRLSILMLTVRDSEDDKAEALEAGADDDITKPFALRELTARIRAAGRHGQAPAKAADAPIQIGEIELDPQRRMVRKSGKIIHFTPKEFDLLHYLMSHPGFPITHARRLSSVWGPAIPTTNAQPRMSESFHRRLPQPRGPHPHAFFAEGWDRRMRD